MAHKDPSAFLPLLKHCGASGRGSDSRVWWDRKPPVSKGENACFPLPRHAVLAGLEDK